MGWADKIMVVLRVIEIVFILNILWLFGFLIGLGLFGAFPTSRAVFLLLDQGVLKREASVNVKDIFRKYWQLYRAQFIELNKFGIPYFIFYLLIYLDFQTTTVMPVKLKVFSVTLIVVLLFYVLLTNIFLLMNKNIKFNRFTIKRTMFMPIAFPIASVIYFVFTVIVTLLSIRFSFIFVACYFSGLLLFADYFLNENVKKRLSKEID